MAQNQGTRQGNQKAKDLIAAWNLLKCGRDIVFANLDLGWENPKNREMNKLNRAYVMAKRDFNAILAKYPEVKNGNGLFENIGNLTAFDNEYMIGWCQGNPLDPENGIYDLVGGKDWCRTELSYLEEEAILAGAEDMNMPEDITYRKTYNDAVEALKDANAAKKLLKGNIKEYSLTWDAYSGRVKINGVFEVAKTQVDSDSAPNTLMRAIKRLQDKGEKEFNFDFKVDGKRTPAQIINEDLHITPLLRKIFFSGSRGKKICFRSPVDREKVLEDGISPDELYELDLLLVKNGAKV